MRSFICWSACFLMTFSLGSVGAAEVMILGSFHFDNPGQDLINIETDDVLAPNFG